MICYTDLKSQQNGMYKEAIRNLEKAKELLDTRYAQGQVSDAEYTKKMTEINAKIEKYKNICGE